MPQTCVVYKATRLQNQNTHNKYNGWVLNLSYTGNYQFGNTDVSNNIPITFVTHPSTENLPMEFFSNKNLALKRIWKW